MRENQGLGLRLGFRGSGFRGFSGQGRVKRFRGLGVQVYGYIQGSKFFIISRYVGV